MPPLSFSLTSTDVTKVKTGLLAVAVFKGPKLGPGAEAVDAALGGTLKPFLKEAGFTGKLGEALAVPSGKGLAAEAVVLVGLGERGKVKVDELRRAAAAVARRASSATDVTTTLLDAVSADVGDADAAQAIAEGFTLGAYQYLEHKGKASENGSASAKASKLRRVKVHGEGATARRGLDAGQLVARGVALTRDLVNGPPGRVTPTRLGQVAKGLKGVRTTVWDPARIRSERLGGLLGVSAGSDEPPRLIRMEYSPPRPRGTVVVVGKGITFDSGGLSLKGTGFIETMKYDMAGGAAVIGLMSVVSELQPGVKVVGIVPTCENMPSGKATKLGDVLTIRNGTTVEVLNTDAEGRLILADGLSLAVEEEPDAIFDLATLTGACHVALGDDYAGMMGNSDDLMDQVQAAADRTAELVWPLPLPEAYRSQLDSDVADLKNVTSGRYGGAITAGLFLQEFVNDVPWVHLDIAGPAWRGDARGYFSKGGSGYGVRLLAELVTTFRKPKRRRKG